MKKIFKLQVLLTLIVTYASAQESFKIKFPIPKIDFNPRSYVAYKISEPLAIDGDLKEESWQNAEWSEKFIDIEGDKEPLHETRIKILWDEDYLYIGAEIKEPHINAQLRQRDTVIFYDNDFEVFIDPGGDTHSYYEFEINALNTVWDLFLNKPYREAGNMAIDGWDINGLKSAVKIYGTLNNPSDTDEKWTVELAFPFKAYNLRGRITPKNNDIWRIGFSRVEWQYEVVDGGYKKKINPQTGKPFPEYNWVWSPQGLINMHYPEMWGFLKFSTKSSEKGNIEFKLSEDEKMKWELRKIYYYQKNYFANHGRFASQITELEKVGLKLNKTYSYTISITQSLFEAQASKGKVHWIINSEGRTWKK